MIKNHDLILFPVSRPIRLFPRGILATYTEVIGQLGCWVRVYVNPSVGLVGQRTPMSPLLSVFQLQGAETNQIKRLLYLRGAHQFSAPLRMMFAAGR
jgi:hypothetical protein